jgi:hypothetical protein
MIKLSIENQKEPEVEKKFEGVLNLEKKDNGDIALIMEDNDGFMWYIAKLKTNGTFSIISNLPDDIGLQVDSDGRIIESEE